jgi:hypothetical protein
MKPAAGKPGAGFSFWEILSRRHFMPVASRYNKLPRGSTHLDGCDGRRSVGAETEAAFILSGSRGLKPPIVCLR